MTHKTFINICLTLIALCWTMAIQAQTVAVDGINYYFSYSSKTAQVTESNVTGDIVIPEKIIVDGVEYPVTMIDYGAFKDCKALTSVKIPSVTRIANDVFSGCSSLSSVDMPLVTSIGDYAFSACPIANLSLPTTLTSIGNGCFTEMREITLAATTPAALGTGVFGINAVIRVPESAVDDYRTAAGWSDYKNQILSMSDITEYDVTSIAQNNTSGLRNVIGEDNLAKVVSLKVKGTINGYDIMIMRNKMPILHWLDLSEANIVANPYEYYTDYHTEDNVVGARAFSMLKKLISIKLPNNLSSG